MKITIELTERALAQLLHISPSYAHKLVSSRNSEQLSEQLSKQIEGVKSVEINELGTPLVSNGVSKPVSKTKKSEQRSEQNDLFSGLEINELGGYVVSNGVSKPESDTKERTKEKNQNNNINNIKYNLSVGMSIEERKQKFYESLIPYVEKYGREMVRDFYDYWSELNRSGTKMRCELQPTWQLGGRLATWSRKHNERKFDSSTQLSVGQARVDNNLQSILDKAEF